MSWKAIKKQFYWLFFINCIVLGWVGAMPAEGVYVLIARIASVYYFSFFLIIMPLLSRFEKVGELPSSISAAVLSKKFDKDINESYAK